MAEGAQDSRPRASETVSSRTAGFAFTLRVSRRPDGAGPGNKVCMSAIAESHPVCFASQPLRHAASDNGAFEKGDGPSKTGFPEAREQNAWTRRCLPGEQGNRGNVCATRDPPGQDHSMDGHEQRVADGHCQLNPEWMRRILTRRGERAQCSS
jgi:hypothetical protein